MISLMSSLNLSGQKIQKQPFNVDVWSPLSNPLDKRHPTKTFCEDGVDHVMGQTWATLSCLATLSYLAQVSV
jgi:hypothetical protein